MLAAKEVMATNLITVAENTPVQTAMRLIVENDITGLPVVDEEHKLVGIISEKDLLKVLYQPHLGDALVMDIMSTDLITFEEDADLVDVAEAMIEGHFRRVPILRDGRIVGLITRRDILRHVIDTRYAVRI
ncbi:MAG TPA: CBS domain-containing protein [Candidatus Hydrogenedentes bacterium]|nr:CBS domain-containing protein [Candidatus Hydrogenedentota bacterium]HNT87737.1 CBS domain-containing protein [Candidatus Hydrogenedentota bacterium]